MNSPVREAPSDGATSSFAGAVERANSPVMDDPSAALDQELANKQGRS